MDRKPPIRRGIKPKETHDNQISQSTHPKPLPTKNNPLNRSTTQLSGIPQHAIKPKNVVLKPRSLGITNYIANRFIHKPELSHRKRNWLRKKFKRNKQVPNGMALLYSISTQDYSNTPSQNYLRQQKMVELQAQALYHKCYRNLTPNQQTHVYEVLNDGTNKAEWLTAKGMKASKEIVH